MDNGIIFQSEEGQAIEGWVTLTPITEEGFTAVYGVFEDKASAEEWLKNTRGGEVRPIFTPAFNKG
jgi:hypothetical protein